MLQSLELNRDYYRDCIAEVVATHCPYIATRHAAALIGWGSEVLGNDDERSKRYGWGPRVVLFLAKEDYGVWRQKLSQTLRAHVPLRFQGHPTRVTDPTLGPPQPLESMEGFLQIPITTCERFIELYLGVTNIDIQAFPLSARDWLLIPEAGLLRLTAGEVYHDGVGEITALREYFGYFPDDVWRYKLAYQWTLLSREIGLIGLCAYRGDTLSARLAIGRSVERIVGLVFLLNRIFKPGYLKWLHRQFYKLPQLASEIGRDLEETILAKDCWHAVQLFYPILDKLIDYQSTCADIPPVDYRRPAELDRGFFAYDLEPVIRSLRESIHGELCEVSFPIGTVDQWLGDQPLLMSPAQLKSLRCIYDWDDPMKVLFDRNEFEHFL